MTSAQREDLYLEWELTSTKLKKEIREDFQKEFGREQSVEQWEEFLIDALNLRRQWLHRFQDWSSGTTGYLVSVLKLPFRSLRFPGRSLGYVQNFIPGI